MLTDSIFEIGVTHEVCEDYALHGTDYAVVADGCSSGEYTDWGCRLLAKAAEEFLPQRKSTLDSWTFLQAAAITAKTQSRNFPNLPDSCLIATLLVAQKMDDVIRATVAGDGVVGGRRRDGRWKIYDIDFHSGAPYYLKYHMFGDIIPWGEQFGLDYDVTSYFGNIMGKDLECSAEATQEERQEVWSQAVSTSVVTKALNTEKPFEEFDFPIDEYEFVFVASDGLDSFYTKTPKGNASIHLLDVLRVLMDFRSFRHGFMRLQRNWSFRQERKGTFKRRNWQNGDDVSTGVIYCGKD